MVHLARILAAFLGLAAPLFTAAALWPAAAFAQEEDGQRDACGDDEEDVDPPSDEPEEPEEPEPHK